MTQEFITKLVENSPVLGPMLFLVWMLKIGNDKMVAQLNEERKGRLDNMDGQIDYLSRRSDECEKDRLALHRDNAALREQLESLRASRQTTRVKVA
jgi:hypothetical protein